MAAQHAAHYREALTSLFQKHGGGPTTHAQPNDADAEPQEGAPIGEEYDTIDALKAAHKLIYEGPCELPGITALVTDKGSVYFLAEEDKTLSSRSQVGGFGGGRYTPTGSGVGLQYAFPNGDASLVQYEGADGKSETMTFYQMLRRVEDLGAAAADFSVAFIKYTRNDSGGNRDSFAIETTTERQYTFDQADSASGATAKLNQKNFFRACVAALPTADLQPVFRFRFERVGKNLKPMKCYVVLRKGVLLKASRPKRM